MLSDSGERCIDDVSKRKNPIEKGKDIKKKCQLSIFKNISFRLQQVHDSFFGMGNGAHFM